jgi:hypothetical protein
MSRRQDVAAVAACVAGSVVLVVGGALPAAGQETPDPGGSPDSPQPSDVAPPALSYDPSYTSDAATSRPQVVVVAPEPEPVDTTPTTVLPPPVPIPPVAGVGSTRVHNPDVWLGGSPGARRTTAPTVAHARSTGRPSVLKDLLISGSMVLATALLLIGGLWPRKERAAG